MNPRFSSASEIPLARIPPFWANAMQALPGPNAVTQTSGSLSGSHFAVDAQNNTSLSTFGGLVQVPYDSFGRVGSTFTLYVDGTAIAAKSLPYIPAYRCVQTGPFCWAAPGPVVYPPQLAGDF